MRVATIDIGTNTTLLLVAEQDARGQVRTLCERAEITRLGRGIGSDGQLQQPNIDRTLHVLSAYAKEAKQHNARVLAIGTEGLRRAPNAAAFLDRAQQILGTAVQVISGDREAELSFLSAQRSFPSQTQGSAVVVDIGGGSTEIIIAIAGQVSFRQSLPLGSVRLTEMFIRNDPPEDDEVVRLNEHIAALLRDVPFPSQARLIGTAGTVTTIAAMAQGLVDYDPAKVHGYRLTMGSLRAQEERLRRANQSERELMPGLDPRRADVIFAGATLLRGIAEQANASDVLVSDRGIRWGLLFDELDRATQPGVAGPPTQG